MTTRKLASGWVELRTNDGAGYFSCSRCERRACYLASPVRRACDSPACVEAMGVFAAEPARVCVKCGGGGKRRDGSPCKYCIRRPQQPALEPTPGPGGEKPWQRLTTPPETDERNDELRCRGCGRYRPDGNTCLCEWAPECAALREQVAALKVALDEAADMLRGRIFTIAGAAPWLDRYADLNGPALEPRAARGQKGATMATDDTKPAEYPAPWSWKADPSAPSELNLVDASGEAIVHGREDTTDSSPFLRELIGMAPTMADLLAGLRDRNVLNHGDTDEASCPFCPGCIWRVVKGDDWMGIAAACPALKLLAALDAARKGT